MRLIAFLFVHGDQVLQEAEVDVVFMRRAQCCKGGRKMAAVPAASAMAWDFAAILSGEIE